VFEDNGPGFPPDIGKRIFKRFVRRSNSPGHGLGLAFVDAVARAHGGAARIPDLAGGAGITSSLPVRVPENISV
jgi:signal transduction histidine kinase